MASCKHAHVHNMTMRLVLPLQRIERDNAMKEVAAAVKSDVTIASELAQRNKMLDTIKSAVAAAENDYKATQAKLQASMAELKVNMA